MPVLIAYFVGAAAAGAVGIGATVAFLGITWGAIIGTIAATAVGGLMARSEQRRQQRAARDAAHAALRDRTVMMRGTVEPREIVLGRVRKGGQIAYVGSTGQHQAKLVIVLALAAHEIDAVEQIWLDDEPVTLDANGHVTTARYVRTGTQEQWVQDATGEWVQQTITTTRHFARVWWYLGTDSQAADARLIELLPGTWTAAHRLRGIAYLVAELDYDDDIWSTGIPQLSAVVRGARVFDPRTGTTAWSENPALLARHYALHPLGGRMLPAQVNDASVIAAANVCDTSVTYQMRNAAGALVPETRALYRAGTVVRVGTQPKAVLDQLAEAMAGMWCVSADRLTLRAGAYSAPLMTLADADFGDLSEVTVTPAMERASLANIVTGTFVDASSGWRVVDLPRVVAPAFVAADGAELPLDVEYESITHAGQAQQVSAVLLREQRQALTVIAQFRMTAYPLEALDTVAVTNERFGWHAKPFLVLSRRWSLDGLVELTLRETDASVYAFGAEFAAVDPAPNTRLPSPWTLPAPGNPVIAEHLIETRQGVAVRVLVSWSTAPARAWELHYRRASTTQWVVLPQLLAPSTQIDDIAYGAYEFRVRAVNALGVHSPWSGITTYEVRWRLSIPPVALTGVTLQGMGGQALITFAPHPDLDVRRGGRILVRHSELLTGATLADTVSIGQADGWPGDATLVIVPLKQGTYFLLAQDSTGQMSAPVTVDTRQVSVLAFNLLQQVLEHPTFAGTHVNTLVSDGFLRLGTTALWDSALGLIDDHPGLIDYVGGVVPEGTYTFASQIDLTVVRPARLTARLRGLTLNVNNVIDSRTGLWDDATGLFDGDIAAGAADAWLEVRQSDDMTTWSAWHRLDAAERRARGFQARVQLRSYDSHVNEHVTELGLVAEAAAIA